jgi:hypothetical protein
VQKHGKVKLAELFDVWRLKRLVFSHWLLFNVGDCGSGESSGKGACNADADTGKDGDADNGDDDGNYDANSQGTV